MKKIGAPKKKSPFRPSVKKRAQKKKKKAEKGRKKNPPFFLKGARKKKKGCPSFLKIENQAPFFLHSLPCTYVFFSHASKKTREKCARKSKARKKRGGLSNYTSNKLRDEVRAPPPNTAVP